MLVRLPVVILGALTLILKKAGFTGLVSLIDADTT
jgi:hypothetical protein